MKLVKVLIPARLGGRKLTVLAATALAFAAAGVQVVETGDVALVGTNGLDAVQNETLMIEGTLRKAGAGTLTIPLERIWAGNGTLDVADGTVRFTRDTGLLPEEVPTDVLAKAAFWVDAEVNVVTNAAGEVTTSGVLLPHPLFLRLNTMGGRVGIGPESGSVIRRDRRCHQHARHRHSAGLFDRLAAHRVRCAGSRARGRAHRAGGTRL